MEDYSEEVGEKLNDLLEKTYDAIGGYNKAAENATSRNLANHFIKNSLQRKEFAQELEAQIRRTEEPANTDHSLIADLHRSWMDVKAFLSKDNDKSMLEEVIKGEQAALNQYKDVLEEKLPQQTIDILMRQRHIIETSLTTIKSLEDILD